MIGLLKKINYESTIFQSNTYVYKKKFVGAVKTVLTQTNFPPYFEFRK